MFNQQYNFEYNASMTKIRVSGISRTTSTTTAVAMLQIRPKPITSTTEARTITKINVKIPPVGGTSRTTSRSFGEGFASQIKYVRDLQIFDPDDRRLAFLSNDAEGACPFWDAIFREELNRGSEFEFTSPADHEDSKYIVAENQVAFLDKDMKFRLFVIRETEETDGEDGPTVHAICEPSMLELNDEIITEKFATGKTAQEALEHALEGTRWQAGDVDSLGTNDDHWYYETVTEAIQSITNVWEGEFRDRIEVDDIGIVGRYIDILTHRGEPTGKRWEIDKDIIKITRKTQSYPKTALYGRGASLETEGGGFSRKIDFADIEWKESEGDPVDKPLGQKWVGDPDALERYGHKRQTTEIDNNTIPTLFARQQRIDPENLFRHRYGIFEDGNIEDKEELLKATWEALQKQKKPIENYEMDVFLLEELTGYDHEKARLGDSTIAIDRRFSDPIEVEARIIVHEYDVSDPDNTGVVELGDFIELYEDEKRLDHIESRLDRTQADARNPEIDDSNFPDEKPDVPTGFTAEGRFETVALSWDYDASSYIAAYELYGSQSQGFTPSQANLIWRGKEGGHVFNADVNEKWYFRLRAVNTHGTASEFTSEKSATTLRINASKKIEVETITKQLLAREAVIDTVHISDGSITNAKIDSLRWDKARGGEMRLGGSGNGNGVFRLYDDSDKEMIRMTHEGLELHDGARLIGDSGVTSVLSFPSGGELGGWQLLGWWGAATSVNRSAFLFADIPENFVVTEATLITRSMPLYHMDWSYPDGFYHAKNIKLEFIEDITKGLVDFPASGEYSMMFESGAGENITQDAWGTSSWTPSGRGVKTRTADVTQWVDAGESFVFATFADVSQDSREASACNMHLFVEGYKY